MAPTFNSRAQNRHKNRTGLVDHDVYEGLPVRQWRRDFVTIAPPPSQETTSSQNDIWAVELPWGMPKDSHLLPQHSQDLLRAARSGKIYKRPAPAEEEEVDPEIVPGDKPEKKDDDLKDKGFTTKSWKQTPRHLEASDMEFLAKRRKGLITLPAKGSIPAPTLIKTTVKMTDAGGNEYVQDIVVPQGQHVEGEVISQTVLPPPVAVQPTPPRRKGPISKKKKNKGPGRGRKKIPLPPSSVPPIGAPGAAAVVPTTEGALGPDGIKIESVENAAATQEDIEMGGNSNAPSDGEDGDDGDEGEGDDSEDDEGSDAHASPSKATRSSTPTLISTSLPTMKEIPDIHQPDTEMSGTDIPTLSEIPSNPDERFGSPLKNVALANSTLNSPLETTTAPSFPSPQTTTANLSALDQTIHEQVLESAPTDFPSPPPNPTIKEELAAVVTLQEGEAEEEMLLDILDRAREPEQEHQPAELPQRMVSEHTASEAEASLISIDVHAAESDLSEPPESRADDAGEEGQVEVAAESEVMEKEKAVTEVEGLEKGKGEGGKQEHAGEDEEDDFPDLLGGLEASLS